MADLLLLCEVRLRFPVSINCLDLLKGHVFEQVKHSVDALLIQLIDTVQFEIIGDDGQLLQGVEILGKYSLFELCFTLPNLSKQLSLGFTESILLGRLNNLILIVKHERCSSQVPLLTHYHVKIECIINTLVIVPSDDPL